MRLQTSFLQTGPQVTKFPEIGFWPLQSTPAGDLLDPQVMQIILKLMQQYPQSKYLIKHSCLAIGHACCNDQLVKESVMANGVFELVCEIFQNYVMLQSKVRPFTIGEGCHTMGHHNLVQLSIRCSINPEIRTAGSS
jgi:hypothetical protein